MATTLVAGPILRRTTKNRVCVWVATALPTLLRLTVTDTQGNRLGQSNLEDLSEQCVQLGKNLCAYLLQARPDQGAGFPVDTLLCYRLDEVDAADKNHPLNLSDLAYGALQHPSFFIPTQLKHLLHGSCRKPHGGFNPKTQLPMPDALSHGHAVLEQHHADLQQRPPILLLTGDQIYADDVAISLLAMLRQQGLALTGRQETLPLTDDQSTAPGTRLDPAAIPLHGRKAALKQRHNASENYPGGKSSGFSSGESENHLFTFGEFAAMYIYAFGNLPAWQPVTDWPQLENLGVADAEAAKTAWEKQIAPLLSFQQTLPQVRKLLANVATYMIFDDHDVTDDWNITGDWYDGVRESPLGRRIVANALAAYWAFQAWGNDPDNFSKDLVFTIQQRLIDDKDDSDIADRYDLHTWKSRGWGFSLPTTPPIIAMDSRTQRQYENPFYPAVLLDRYALDWLRVEWAKLKTHPNVDSNASPLIVATTPVMGFSAIELIQQLGLWLAGLLESWKPIRILEHLIAKEGFVTGWMVTQLDAESWSSNKEGFVNFMDAVRRRMGIQRCTFLSGDVHYAFTANAVFKHQGRTLQCYQLTSTALSNQPEAKQSRFLEEAGEHGSGIKTHRNWALLPSQRWSAEVQLLRAENSELRVTAECNLGLVTFDQGVPVTHTLLTGSGNLVYRLPA